MAEGVPFDWVRVDLQCGALQGHDDNPPTRFELEKRHIALLLLLLLRGCFLDEVQAVRNDTQREGPGPLARDLAEVLASDRVDLQRVV